MVHILLMILKIIGILLLIILAIALALVLAAASFDLPGGVWGSGVGAEG